MWKDFKLGDVSLINDRIVTKDYPFENIEYLDTGSITEGKVEKYQYFRVAEAPSRAKRLVSVNDIIYSTVRPVQRHYGFINKCNPNLVVSTGFVTITANNELVNPKFLYYLVTTKEVVELLDMIAEGSTSAYPSFRPEDISSLEISIPSLYEQNAIAEVLSCLDNKIDLLLRQNETLGQIAETIFRQWFVEEGEQGFELKKLGTLVKTTSGGTPKRDTPEYFQNGFIKWVKSKELKGSFIFETEEYITDDALQQSSAKMLPEYSILIAMYGATVGEYGILGTPATCNQAICGLIPNEKYPFTYLFSFVKYNKEYIITTAVGSAQQNISQDLIKELEISTNTELISKFHCTVQPVFQKIKSNCNQIRTLTQLRDILLPKLMSGEVGVKY
jgi:type I restriction enzyme, S subunit